MNAWLFQDTRQKKKLGEDKCPWSVGWIDPEGRKRSKTVGRKSAAERYARKIEGQLAAGTYQAVDRVAWEKFRAEWKTKIGDGMEPQSCRCTLDALRHFERIVNPKLVKAVKTQTIDEYVAKRRGEAGVKKGSKVSPATVNKELRHLKSVLRVACDWGYIAKPPKVRMVKEPQKIKGYVTPEHLAMIYSAAEVAKRPASPDFTPGDWWRGLLVFGYMTGWRIRQILALRWEDVSLDNATAITRHCDNKAKRDRQTPLHPLVVEHMRKLADASVGGGPGAKLVFWWPHNDRTLWADFYRIQLVGGITPNCGLEEAAYPKKRKNPGGKATAPSHRHSTSCGLYGFHDLRRAFATENFDRMAAEELQAMMQHACYTTTQRYINMARQLKATAEKVFVPSLIAVPRDLDHGSA